MCAWGGEGSSRGVPGEGVPGSPGGVPGPNYKGHFHSSTLGRCLKIIKKPFKNVCRSSQGGGRIVLAGPGGVFGCSWWGLGRSWGDLGGVLGRLEGFLEGSWGGRSRGLRAARLNPPPPEGSERDWIEIKFLSIFDNKPSHAHSAPPLDLTQEDFWP